jgi:hypothetical protein
MGVFHAIQGVLMLILSNDFSLPVTTSYLKFDVLTQKLVPETEKFFDLRFGPFVASFLLISATAHLLIAGPAYEWYVKKLKKGMNLARWYEYSISSSIMIVLIAMLTGVYDFSTIILIFSINAIMIFGGLMMEVWNQGKSKPNWISYIVGCFAGAIPWIVIALHLFGSGEGEYKAPTFVYWIFFSIFLLFNTFSINMLLQYKKVGKWKKYLFGEYIYILLSLLAKSALAWQVFAGTLMPA